MLSTRPVLLPSRVAPLPLPWRVRSRSSAKLPTHVPQTLMVSPAVAAVMAVGSADAPLDSRPVRTFFVWHAGAAADDVAGVMSAAAATASASNLNLRSLGVS